jgi:hypothetical protein
MYAFDEKFANAYQQKLIRIATNEDNMQDDHKLHQALGETIESITNRVRHQQIGANPKTIHRPGLRILLKSKLLSSLIR